MEPEIAIDGAARARDPEESSKTGSGEERTSSPGTADGGYKSLFESIDRAICVIEIVHDANGSLTDLIFRTSNSTFELHTGLSDVVGKSVHEILPNLESHWKEVFSRVLETGEPSRNENYVAEVGRWYSMHSARIDGSDIAQIGVVFEDISERKRAEVERNRYFDLGSDLQVKISADGYFTWVSPSFERVLGRKSLEMLGSPWIDFVHPDDAPRASADADQLFSTKGRGEFECRFRHRDGSYLWLLWNGRYHDDEGVVYAAGLDISERKRAEHDVRESEERFRVMADALPQLVWMMDAEGRPEFLNRQWAEFSGVQYTPETAAQIAANSIHPEDGPKVLAAFSQARAEERGFEIEQRNRSASGEYRWFLNRGEPYRDRHSGKISKWIGSGTDIHDRKIAEDALRGSRQKLETALKAGRMGSWELDLATGELVSSPTCKANYGREPQDDFTYQDLAECIVPEDMDRWREIVGAAIRECAEFEVEYRIHWPDGSLHWVLVRGNCFADERGQAASLAGVSTDITESKNAEMAVRRSEEEYRSLFNSIDEGYCVIEMIFDDQGYPVDYLFEQINPSFAELTGLPQNSAGRTMREMIPDHEDSWFEIYGRVAQTGDSIRFENYSKVLDRWFDLYALRIGGEGSRRVGVLFNNITARKHREENLKFLAGIGEVFGRFSKPDEIMQAAGRRIGEYLDVKYCQFLTVDQDRDEVYLLDRWSSAEVPPLPEKLRLSDYVNEEFYRLVRAGQTVSSRNAENDRITKREPNKQIGAKAFITVPFHKDGEWKYLFSVSDDKEREWRDDEIELVRELGNRLFPRLERARAEAALRESEEKLRLLFESMDEGFCVIEFFDGPHGPLSDYIHVEANPAYTTNAGIPDIVGQKAREMVPGEADGWVAIYKNVLTTGEPIRFERELVATGRYLELSAFRVEPVERRQVAVLFKDITGRKMAENKLRESEERMRLAMKASAILSWELDVEANQTAVSDNFEEVLGFSAEERPAELDDSIAKILHPDDAPIFKAEIERTIRGGGDHHQEFRVVHPGTGETVWVESHGTMIKAEADRGSRLVGIVQNINDRKLAQEALRESSEFNQAIIDSLSAHISVLDRNGVITAVNEAWRRFAADNGADWSMKGVGVGVNYLAICQATTGDDAEDARMIAGGIKNVLDGSEDFFSIEYPCHSPTHERWFMLAVSPLGRKGGGAVVSHTNITERRKAENALRESEARFRNMADNAPVMIWVTEPDGACTYLSQSWYEFTGQTPDTGLGAGWLNAVHPDDVRETERIFLAANQKREPFRLEYRLRRADGQYRWAIDSAQPRFAGNGEFLGYIGSSIDIDERKKAEELARLSQERFDIVKDGIGVGFWFCDLPFDELVWDNRVKEHFWLDREARVTIDVFYDRLHPEDRERTRAAIEGSIRNKTYYDIEYRTMGPEDEFKWIRAIGRAFFDDQGQAIRFDGVTLDITKEKHDEAALQLAEVAARDKELLEKLVKFQEAERHRIARDLHDHLGQQLTGMRLTLADLADGSKHDPSLVEKIKSVQQKALALDKDVSSLAFELRADVPAGQGLAGGLESFVSEWSRNYGIPAEFHANGPRAYDRFPEEIETHLYRIVQEALNNATKHASADKVDVILDVRQADIRLIVEDDGVGFDRSASRSKSLNNGQGLGLLGMKERVELLGGRLEIDSTIGKGTTVFVNVPR